jgi:hypothetical protein
MDEPQAIHDVGANIARRSASFLTVASFRGAATGAAGMLLLLAVGLTAWRCYTQWRLGRIELNNAGPPLTVQVLAESDDEPVGEAFDIAKHAVMSLPAGDYRLRATAPGRLGRTYRFAVNRGETQAYSLSLGEGRLLGGEHGEPFNRGERDYPEPVIPFATTTVALELRAGKADMIEWAEKSLVRRDAVTGQVIWDAYRPAMPFEPGRDPAVWIRPFSGQRVTVVEPAPDLDGDGTADLVWAFGDTPSLLGSRVRTAPSFGPMWLSWMVPAGRASMALQWLTAQRRRSGPVTSCARPRPPIATVTVAPT